MKSENWSFASRGIRILTAAPSELEIDFGTMHKYVLQSIKDARRRSVESFMNAVGATDRTYDAEFESHSKHFKALYDDMNE